MQGKQMESICYFEKIAKIAEYNYGETNVNYLSHFKDLIERQLHYNSVPLKDQLANTTRLTALGNKLFSDKASEIQKVPLLELHCWSLKTNGLIRDAIQTQEEIIAIYSRATTVQAVSEASPPSGVTKPSEA